MAPVIGTRTSGSRRADDVGHAARVSLGLLLPGSVLLVLGRPDLMTYAAFGSFVGMYGRFEGWRPRLLHQLAGAVLLLAGSAVGIAVAALAWPRPGLVVVAAVFGALGSLFADRLGLRPEGPFYGLFALGATAGIPADRASPFLAWGVCAGGAVLAIAVGTLAVARRAATATTFRWSPARDRRPAFVHALRYLLAVGLAGAAGMTLGLDHVNWAIVGAAVTLAAEDPRSRLRRGFHRVVGTVVGLAATDLLLLPDPGPTVLGVVVICLMFPTELFMTRHYALALGFFTPMIMLMTDLAAPTEPHTLIADRAWGTLAGVAVGAIVALAVREPPASRTDAPFPSLG